MLSPLSRSEKQTARCRRLDNQRGRGYGPASMRLRLEFAALLALCLFGMASFFLWAVNQLPL